MNTKQMRYFVAVAEELNFRRAAKRLYMTQPPLSQQIAALEEELGTPLFIRTHRRVELTEAGRTLLEDARPILGSMEAAKQRAMDTGAGRTGRLRIGFVGPAIDGPLPPDIKRFREEYPGVTLALHEATTPQQLEMLRNRELDAGVVRLTAHDTRGLSCIPYHSEPYVLAVPEDHPLARRTAISLTELDGLPMILSPRHLNPQLFDAWASAFARAKARLNVAQEAVTKHTCVALVAAGHGLSPVPESTASSGRRGVSFVPLRGGIPPLTLHIAIRQPVASAVLQAFLEQLAIQDFATAR